MKTQRQRILPVLLAGACLAAGNLLAQGIYNPAFTPGGAGYGGAGSYDDDDMLGQSIPINFTLNTTVGYDTNVNATSVDPVDSWFIGAGVGTIFSGGTRSTRYYLGADFNVYYYQDQVPEADDTEYSVRLRTGISHRVNPRLSIRDDFSASYEQQPDFNTGMSAGGRQGQYIYLHNSLALTYQWRPRFSTVTSYHISYIDYDEDLASIRYDRWQHLFAQAFRYAATRRTAVVAEYRLGYVDYTERPRNSLSHYALLGADHAFTRYLSGTLRLGAEWRDDSAAGDQTAPYGEFGLTYRLTKDTSIHWYNRYGLDNTDLGAFSQQLTFRSNLTAKHYFSPRFSGNAGISYYYSKYEDNMLSDEITDFNEHFWAFNLGLHYSITDNFGVAGGYSYSNRDSGREFADYDRHRIYVGLTATF